VDPFFLITCFFLLFHHSGCFPQHEFINAMHYITKNVTGAIETCLKAWGFFWLLKWNSGVRTVTAAVDIVPERI